MTEPLGSRIKASVKISFATTILSGIVQAGVMIVLARLLAPRDYGLYALALSVNGLSVQFLTSAIERALLLERDDGALRGRVLPIVGLLLGTSLLTLAICALVVRTTAWQIDLRVLAVVGVGQAMAGIAIVPRAIWRRRLAYGRVAAGELGGLLLGNLATAALLARAGWGVWSLVAGYVVALIVTALSVTIGVPKIREARISGDLARTVVGMSKVAGLEAVNGQIPPLVLSAVLGVAPLGLYNRIYTLTTLPVQLLINSFNRVMVSALVAVAEDRARRLRAADLLFRISAALITPLALGLAGSRYAFVDTVLGPKWLAAAPLMPFLAVAVWCTMIAALMGMLAESTRRLSDKVRIQAIALVVLIVALLAGSIWSLIGVAIGSAIAAMLFLGLYARLTADILGVGLRTILAWFVPGWIAGAACLAATTLVARALAGVASPIVLALQIGMCGVIVLVTYLIVDRRLLHELALAVLPDKAAALILRILRLRPVRSPLDRPSS